MALQAAAVCWDRLQAALFCPNCSKCLDAMGRHIFLRNTREPSLSAAKSAQSLWPCWTAIFKGLQPPGSREAKLKMLLVIKSSRLRVWLLSAAAWMRHLVCCWLAPQSVGTKSHWFPRMCPLLKQPTQQIQVAGSGGNIQRHPQLKLKLITSTALTIKPHTLQRSTEEKPDIPVSVP